jgi:hypothetical protein
MSSQKFYEYIFKLDDSSFNVLYALAWENNTLWDRPRLSVCLIFEWVFNLHDLWSVLQPGDQTAGPRVIVPSGDKTCMVGDQSSYEGIQPAWPTIILMQKWSKTQQ